MHLDTLVTGKFTRIWGFLFSPITSGPYTRASNWRQLVGETLISET